MYGSDNITLLPRNRDRCLLAEGTDGEKENQNVVIGQKDGKYSNSIC